MNVNSEFITSCSQEDFLKLCKCIGYKNLSIKFIEACKNTNKLSKYYIGKINGKFWNGFRITNIKVEKISEILFDERKKENPELDSIDIIRKSLDKKFCNEINEENIVDYLEKNDEIEYYSILLKVYDLKNVDENSVLYKIKENKYNQELESLKEEIENYKRKIEVCQTNINDYKEKIKDTKNKNTIEINNLKNEIEKLKIENRQIKELEKEILKSKKEIGNLNLKNENLKKNNEKQIIEFINHLLSINTSKDDIQSILEKEKIENKEELRIYLDKLLELNLINFREGNNMSNILVEEYVLLKILEE